MLIYWFSNVDLGEHQSSKQKNPSYMEKNFHCLINSPSDSHLTADNLCKQFGPRSGPAKCPV